jgi:PAS domain S-box-containing protein
MSTQPRVLLVDDRPENLLALSAVLEPLPCELVTVTSGEEALKELLNGEFALVLLDVQMPGMDGFETAELIKARERTRTLPIIFVTAISKERHHVFRGYESGAVDYVFKPYDPGILRSKVSVFLELDAASRARTRAEATIRAAFDHAPIGMVRVDLDGRIAEANRALATLLGCQPRELRDRLLEDYIHPEDRPGEARRRTRILSGGAETYELELRLVRADEEEVECAMSASVASGADGAPDLVIVQVQDLTERRRAQAERERRMLEQAARKHAEQSSERSALIQRITDVALSTLSFDELVGELLHRTADALTCDTAAITLRDADEQHATVYQVAGAVDAPVQTHRWTIPDDTGAHPLGQAVTSAADVPLVVEGRAIGSVHVGTLFARDFSPEDLSLLGLAADRAGLAIERVRVFEREHRIAQRLQESLLPDELPQVPGIIAAARYQPAGAGSQVGGDWYDVLLQPDGNMLLVIGDVAGRGIEAAATMGQLRSALRAYAFDGHGPGAILERLNAFQHSLGETGMATVSLVSVSPTTGALCYASAGHPPALLVADGRSQRLDGAGGIPLGVLDEAEYRQVTADVHPGATLVLYTDGLVERRTQGLDEGLDRLVTTVEGLVGASADELLDGVMASMLEGEEARDDVCVLLLTAEA